MDQQPHDGFAPDTIAVRGGLARSGFEETSEALYLTSGFVYESAEDAERAAAEGARLEVGPGLGGAGTGVAVHWGGTTPEAAHGVLPAAEGRMDA